MSFFQPQPAKLFLPKSRKLCGFLVLCGEMLKSLGFMRLGVLNFSLDGVFACFVLDKF